MKNQSVGHIRGRSICVLAIIAAAASTAVAGEEFTASKSIMVQKTGPRTGDNGSRYFNVQGKQSGEGGKYASFGVLEFAAPKADSKRDANVKAITLTLVQSVPSFAKDGKIRFYLTTDTKTVLASAEGASSPTLKFDERSPDSVGAPLQTRHAIGAGAFKKQETGHADSFTLTLDETTRGFLKGQIENGGPIRLVVVPDDDDVAATYAGAGNATAASRPKLTIELDPSR